MSAEGDAVLPAADDERVRLRGAPELLRLALPLLRPRLTIAFGAVLSTESARAFHLGSFVARRPQEHRPAPSTRASTHRDKTSTARNEGCLSYSSGGRRADAPGVFATTVEPRDEAASAAVEDGVSDPGAVSCWEGRFRAAILDAEAPSHRAGGLKNCLVRGSGEGGPYVLALEHTSNSLPMRSPNPEGTDLAVHQKLREGLDDRLKRRASLSQASR